MKPKGFHRKLNTILSADVAGYGVLMQDDEAATVKTFESYKKIISDLVKQPYGRPLRRRGQLKWNAALEASFLDNWITRSDAQNYMIFGDPAGRLRIPTG